MPYFIEKGKVQFSNTISKERVADGNFFMTEAAAQKSLTGREPGPPSAAREAELRLSRAEAQFRIRAFNNQVGPEEMMELWLRAYRPQG